LHDTINPQRALGCCIIPSGYGSVSNNHFIFDKRVGLGSIAAVSLTRSFSSGASSRSLANNLESLALEHINSGKPTTSTVINKILLNQNLSVTESKLEELLKVKGVELDLPISTPEYKTLLDELAGKSKYKGFSGVYIFIHKSTGHKYVGSSNLLRRRMDYYFKGDFPLAGKFLPLLHKDGLKAFKLIIFKLDSNKFSNQDALILEQYYLLNKEFNLNTLRIVNAGSSKGDAVYVYDLTCSTLYYHAKSKIELKRVLKIHTETSKKFVDSKIPYLNKFLLLSYPIPTALTSNISVEEVLGIMQKERQDMYTLGTRRSISVQLEIKEGNIFVDSTDHALNFDSLTSCIEYLRGLGLTIKRDTLTKYIKNEKVFHNFLCKYSDKTLPYNFEEVGLIIDEYKKLKIDTYSK
jgi:GIY-YIG catalytic domain